MFEPRGTDPRPRRSTAGLLFLALLTLFVGRLIQVGWALPRDRMMPGTRVAGVDLSGWSWDEAESALDAAMRERTIVLRSEARSYTTTPAQLGLEIDLEDSLRSAFAAGRERDGRLRSLIPWLPVYASPTLRLDPSLAGLRLREASASLDRAPVPAALSLEGGRAVALRGEDGLGIDVPAAIARLEADAAEVLRRGEFSPPMRRIPPAPADASPAAAAANRLLVQPMRAEAYDPVSDAVYRWEIAPRLWTRWLDVGLDPARPERPDWRVDAARVAEDRDQIGLALPAQLRLEAADVAERLPAALAEEPPTLRLRAYHRPRTHRVSEGDTIAGIAARYGLPYPYIEARNPGAATGLWPGQELSIPPADALIPLPPVREKRIRVDLSEQVMIATDQGRELWRWPVSTGIDDSPTAPGVYQVRSLEAEAYAPSWDLHMPFFVGIYPPLPGEAVMNGFHGFPTQGGSQVIWTDRIGAPATYGCVLLPSDRAEALFGWAEVGVIVEIVP